jgi:N utilization substance protein A
MLNNRVDTVELIRIVDAVANEKSIDKELVLTSMEEAIEKAARTRYGQENNIYVSINRANGQIELGRRLKVVENPSNSQNEISLKDAKKIKSDIALDQEILEPLPPVDFGRIAAQAAKQVITTKVRDAEREKQYNEFKDKIGEVLSGIVKRIEFGNIIVDLQKAESIIKRDELIPRENIKVGDRIKAYCYEVKREAKGPQILVARDPGSRAKICVTSKDKSIDPVGACVGMRGSRVQAVVNELQGEKIDIIHWSEDPATLVINALAPAEVQKVVLDEASKRIEVVIDENNLSKAIGRRGQNVRLASKLMNYEIDILTDQEETEKRQSEFKIKTKRFIESLEIDEMMAQLLVLEGFSSIKEIDGSPLEEITKIDGFDADTAKELKERAKEYLETESKEISNRVKELGIQDDLMNHQGLSLGMLLTLGEKNIKTLADFADLSVDEILGGYDEVKGKRVEFEGILQNFDIIRAEAERLIMSAREKVFNK